MPVGPLGQARPGHAAGPTDSPPGGRPVTVAGSARPARLERPSASSIRRSCSGWPSPLLGALNFIWGFLPEITATRIDETLSVFAVGPAYVPILLLIAGLLALAAFLPGSERSRLAVAAVSVGGAAGAIVSLGTAGSVELSRHRPGEQGTGRDPAGDLRHHPGGRRDRRVRHRCRSVAGARPPHRRPLLSVAAPTAVPTSGSVGPQAAWGAASGSRWAGRTGRRTTGLVRRRRRSAGSPSGQAAQSGPYPTAQSGAFPAAGEPSEHAGGRRVGHRSAARGRRDRGQAAGRPVDSPPEPTVATTVPGPAAGSAASPAAPTGAPARTAPQVEADQDNATPVTHSATAGEPDDQERTVVLRSPLAGSERAVRPGASAELTGPIPAIPSMKFVPGGVPGRPPPGARVTVAK